MRLCSLNYFALSGSVGVGTSTYMALGFLYWLGGTVLFGVAALSANVQPRPVKNSNMRAAPLPSRETREGRTRKCPYCAEFTMPEAIV